MTTRGVLRLLPCIVLLFVSGAQAQSPLPAGLPEAAKAPYQQGLDAEHQQFYDIALEKYQNALRAAPGSQACMEAMLRIQTDMGDDKAQLATAAKMIASATDGKAKAHAEALQADIYYRQFNAYNEGPRRV